MILTIEATSLVLVKSQLLFKAKLFPDRWEHLLGLRLLHLHAAELLRCQSLYLVLAHGKTAKHLRRFLVLEFDLRWAKNWLQGDYLSCTLLIYRQGRDALVWPEVMMRRARIVCA